MDEQGLRLPRFEHRCAEHEHRFAEHEKGDSLKGDSLDLVTIGESSPEPLRFDPFERPPSGVVPVLSAAVLVLVLESSRKAGVTQTAGILGSNRIALIHG